MKTLLLLSLLCLRANAQPAYVLSHPAPAGMSWEKSEGLSMMPFIPSGSWFLMERVAFDTLKLGDWVVYKRTGKLAGHETCHAIFRRMSVTEWWAHGLNKVTNRLPDMGDYVTPQSLVGRVVKESVVKPTR